MIDLSKNNMEQSFSAYCRKIFELPEINCITVRDTVIKRDDLKKSIKSALESSYHDAYSDIDMLVRVCLPRNGTVTEERYIKRIDRFGVTKNAALGWYFVPENRMYRIVFRDGMRYDLGFEFDHEGDRELKLGEPDESVSENDSWPTANIDRFWFVQIQALGKLYRRDYLIGAHLANMNINETLVMQMVLRDLKYCTNHHRYGYSEELEYNKDLGKMPYKAKDPTFYNIADRIYAAAMTYDRLARVFYPGYEDRSGSFFAIWDCYDRCSNL